VSTELETPVFRSKTVGWEVVCRQTYLPLMREAVAGDRPPDIRASKRCTPHRLHTAVLHGQSRQVRRQCLCTRLGREPAVFDSFGTPGRSCRRWRRLFSAPAPN